MIVRFEQKKEDEVERAPSWLLSFADVSALLLAFFVMLFSMSTIKTEEFTRIISKTPLEESSKSEAIPPQLENKSITLDRVVSGQSPEYLYRVVENKIRDAGLSDNFPIYLRDDRLVIEIPSLSGTQPLLNQRIGALVQIFQQIENRIGVTVHEDLSNNENTEQSWVQLLKKGMDFARMLNDMGYMKQLPVYVRKSQSEKQIADDAVQLSESSVKLNVIIYSEIAN